MAGILDRLMQLNTKINTFIWGPYMLAAFLLIGIYFTVRTGFFQFAKVGLWFRHTLLSCFQRGGARETRDKEAISPFQAMTTALASSIGTGNIAGVATAIVLGGPGAVFWMWVSAIFGMMTNFAENVLGSHFRYKDKDGKWVGGPMIYMERGLSQKWLGVVFAFCTIFGSLGMGNLTQSNSMAAAMQAGFSLPPFVTGIAAAVLVGMIIMGGIKRIARVTEQLVPMMAILYVAGGLVLLCLNANRILPALSSIFTDAFSFQAAGAGALGFGISRAMRYGIARGVFTNEAGLGSSVLAHSASDVREPVVQGMWGIFEVFADTIVMCSITALIILTSGVYEATDLTGSALTIAAFSTRFGSFGVLFVSVSTVLFAFCTLVGWSYYGERAASYIFGQKSALYYRVVYIFCIFIGAISSLDLVWSLSDTFNGMMAVPNLIAVALLSGTVIKLTKDYLKSNRL